MPKTGSQTLELLRCMGHPSAWPRREKWKGERAFTGFRYWVKKYAVVQDAVTKEQIPVTLWSAQLDYLKRVFKGEDIALLKARQLGMTEALKLYVTWCLNFKPNFIIYIFNQDKIYAQEFLRLKIDPTWQAMPDWMRRPLRKSDDGEVSIREYGDSWGRTTIYAMAATSKSSRSQAPNLVIYDEAAYIKYLKEAYAGSVHGTESAHGQTIMQSTSNGPWGEFYETFQGAKAHTNRFTALFYPWWCRPGRTDEWYQKELNASKADPIQFKRDMPSKEEDAWLARNGACLPFFQHEKHVKTWAELCGEDWQQAKSCAILFRCIDWGQVDPFVTLWAAWLPKRTRGFTVEPDCHNLIREMASWSRLQDGRPDPKNNCHAVDALRYLLKGMMPNNSIPEGHIHVYRELYEPNSAERGLNSTHFQNVIKLRSQGESIDFTWCDPSEPGLVSDFTMNGVPCQGAPRQPGDMRYGLIEEGIRAINELLGATPKLNFSGDLDLTGKRLRELNAKIAKMGCLSVEERHEYMMMEPVGPIKTNRTYRWSSN